MTASLFLLGLAWTLPLGFLGWSYYQHRVATQASVSCRVVRETVNVDLNSDAWMVTANETSPCDEVALPSATACSYQAEVPKGEAIVRIHLPSGATSYRRCDTFLN